MYRIVGSLMLLLFCTTSSAASLLLCANCTSQTNFNSLALSAAPNQVGTYEYYVMNPNSTVVYDVVVEVDGDVQAGGQHVRGIDSSTTSSQMNSAFGYWYTKFFPANSSGGAFDYQAPLTDTPDGMTTFNSSSPEVQCNAFTGTTDFVDMHHQYNEGGILMIAYNTIMQYFGHGPTAVFIFANGDVAMYYIYPNLPGNTACAYVPGSARNSLGQFIDDSGHNGTGHTNGSDYVAGGSGNYWIYMDTYTLVCSYLENTDGSREFLGCEVQ